MSLMEELERSRREDAEAFDAQDADLCQLCGAHGPDMRTMMISCLYDMKEVAPEFLSLWHAYPEYRQLFALRICRSCRGDILDAMRTAMSRRRNLRGSSLSPDGDEQDAEEDE